MLEKEKFQSESGKRPKVQDAANAGTILVGDGANWLTVVSGLKTMRSTLRNFAARTSNRIVVLDTVSNEVIARANLR